MTSSRIAKLGWADEVFYRRLMSVVDDFGRYYADAGMLRAACYPRQLSKVTDADIGKWLTSCEAAGLVSVYRASDRECYLQLLDFGQQIRAKKSKFPDVPSECVADAQQVPANAPVFVSVSVSEDVSDKPPPQAAFVPPDWIPKPTWDAYLAVRKTKRAGKEPSALRLIVKDLEKFKAAGHDPIAVLESSIKSCWVGVFEPKGKPERTVTAPSQDAERTAQYLREQSRQFTPEEKTRADEARRRAMEAVTVIRGAA